MQVGPKNGEGVFPHGCKPWGWKFEFGCGFTERVYYPMDPTKALLRACLLCCKATNGLLVNSSPNMPALCATRAVLRERASGDKARLAIVVELAQQCLLHDLGAGTVRRLEDSDIEFMLTEDPAEVLEQFYQTFDILSLQDAAADFPSELVSSTAAAVLDVLEECEGRVFNLIRVLLGAAEGVSSHPLNMEALCMYREGIKSIIAQAYGLLTLSVLYDLAHNEFQNGTSLFSDRFSSEFQSEVLERFDMSDLEGLTGAVERVYEMLVCGELTL
jgi:hypothetical protein